MYYDRVNTPTVAGLPLTKANPSYSKDTFRLFIPKFADYIDREKGQVESIINNVTPGTLISDVSTKISFNNGYVRENADKSVIDIDDNNDVIIGKITIFGKGCLIISLRFLKIFSHRCNL